MTTSTAPAARVAGKKGFSLISDDKFRELYGALLMCRMVDERRPSNIRLETWRGREAASAGTVACLRPGDSVIASPRAALAEYLHKKRVTCPNGLSSVAQLAAATGEALRHKLEKKGHVAVVFASGEPEYMREVFAAASANSLPVFYVFESDPLLTKVSGAIPVIRVDACDTVAVYRVAHESIARARDCGGPTIMECATWLESGATDPLIKLENYLADKKLFHKSWKKRLQAQYAKSLEALEAHADARSQCTPGEEML